MKLTTSFASTSVCIASVGRRTLIELVLSLYKNSYSLLDFFICIPDDISVDLVDRLRRLPSTRLIYTSVRNQVYQRHLAISHVTRPYVLQLDDDVVIDSDSLHNLFLAHHNQPFGSATSPLLITHDRRSFFSPIATGQPGNYISHFRAKAIAFLLGYPEVLDDKLLYGRISKSGVPVGVPYDPSLELSLLLEVEFLSGCCMLLPTLYAQIDNYYPFQQGRASLEDLFHSKYLTSRAGLRLYMVTNSYLSLEVSDGRASDWANLRNLTQALPRQLEFNRTYGYSCSHYLLFYFAYSLMLSFRLFFGFLIVPFRS